MSAATRRPFTLIVCTGCDAAESFSVFDRLKGTVRRCSHGVMVAAGSHDGSGTLVLLQPCWPDRSPVGSARWLGPVVSPRDANALCDWVEDGEWDVAALPQRLRPRQGPGRWPSALPPHSDKSRQ